MSEPRVGDGCWVEGYTQPNGRIEYIDWHDKEVHVRCYDTQEVVVLEWDQLDTYNQRLNQWLVHK